MSAVSSWSTTVLPLVEALATVAFALSGILESARKRLDAVGVCTVAFLCAFGGGTLRDLLLDQRPFFWVRHTELLWAVLGMAALSMAVLRESHREPTERLILIPDALGLGLFTAGGTQAALAADMPALVAVLLGVVTAVFGGLMRDLVCNEIPAVLKDHRPYAVCAFAGAWVMVLLWHLGAEPWWSLWVSAATTAGLRGVAVYTHWSLPSWRS
jgi:uncharacterized membrane protein YeiH